MIGQAYVVDRDDQQDCSWSGGDQTVAAMDVDFHGVERLPTRFAMTQIHSNMGSRFAFCSSQESFRS